MKALVFTTLYPNPEEPNKATFIRDRVRHVAARAGVEIEVVAPVPYFPRVGAAVGPKRWAKFARVPIEETRNGLRVHHPRYLVTPRVGMSRYGAWLERGAIRCLRRIRERFVFDIIDCHYLYPDAYAGVRLARRFGVPAVVSARGTDTHTYADMPRIRPKLVETVSRADGVIAVSEDLRRRIEQLVPGREITVIPNGVDTARFAPVDRNHARRGLGLPEDELIILAVGRLTGVKGHEVLLRAFRRLIVPHARAAKLVIVGGGELRGSLERLAEELGISDRVRFAGERPQEELGLWYSAADVSCLPSFREGWPNAVMESLACATPVVASEVGGASEILDDPGRGHLVPPGDAQALGDALRRATDQPWDRERIRAYAIERSWEKTAERVVDVLRQAHESPVSP